MIYLDNAATSYPKPEGVKREILQCIDVFGGNPGRSSHRLAMLASEKIYDCRCRVCDFFGASLPENVVFTYNATYALNMAIKTEYKVNSHILISDMEHNSVYRPVYSLKKNGLCSFDIFSSEGDVVDNISKLIKKNTDMLICTHISNVSGRVLPIDKIGELCKKHGIYFIVDAAQSAGHKKIRLDEFHCDALCAPAHKGLFGIQGCGFVIFNKRRNKRTFIEGGSGVNSASPFMPIDSPEMYEAGTLSTPAISALAEGIRFIEDITLPELEQREKTLRYFLSDRLCSIKGITVQDLERECASVISFYSDTTPSDIIGAYLDEKGICVRTGLHCSPLAHKALRSPESGSVRVSLSYFNTIKDIDTFYQALKNALKAV
jgi:cysteine desulfurase family protein